MKKKITIISIIYSTVVAAFASGNLIHKFFATGNTDAEQAFNSAVFDDPSLPSFENSTNSSINSTNLSLNPSPYKETTTYFERIPNGTDSRGNNVIYYILEIKIKKIQDLRTNLVTNSSGVPGNNITDTVYNQINLVEKNSGITVEGAISGDSAYSFTERPGYVIRNSQVFRSTKRNGEDARYEDLVLFRDGTMSTFMEKDYETSDLVKMNAWQTWMFGPTLVKNGKINVTEDEEIVSGKSSGGGNQRVAIGYLGPFHYLFFVSQGRTKYGDKDGFSLHDMAKILVDRGCSLAYNLDGGGSATFYCLDEEREAKKYPTQTQPRSLGDMIYVVNA